MDALNSVVSMRHVHTSIPGRRWARIIPPILMACIISYMDRVNIGFAMPGGMSAELGINASMVGMAGGIFFLGYLFLQIPGGRLAVHGSGKKFIAWSLVSWAVISVLTGFVRSNTELLILRFLLGVAEGGMLPVVLTMVSNWFPDKERGRANALVILFVPIAGIVTAPLSGILIATLSWRYLFFIEGALSLVFLLVWWTFASDRPGDAKWISGAEREYILGELHAEQERARAQTARSASLRQVIADSVMWRLIGLNFFYQMGIYGYTLWLPTILKNLTHGSMAKVGLLAVLPYVGTMIGMLAISNLSDRLGKRKLFVAVPIAAFALCMFGSVRFQGSPWVSYAFLIGCGVCLQAAAGVFWTIPPRLFSAEVAGGARGVINALGNLGGFCGPYLVGVLIQKYDASIGVYSLAAALVLAGLIAATLPAKCDQ
ncbi:MFS transporter [Paraburkholderia nemoris]|uniref:Quinolone resistance transporter n=1 Tax=Paraburkholderia nemoris TaxID=2793076 RepID=A0ABM8SX55_9BURK|nr:MULTISPECIES: MFS transporter [Paraburkholderia]MBK3815194.1 MFS transporter [Paraburkholderia aspalathi]CAE6713457.1 Quinolone resistance transporter [Paraburkholderia nemoris]CAE6839279.1 Quinolone resistance transporter [Paraburkholderia nemoris]